MEPLATALRRAALLTVFAALAAAAWSWWREQTAPPTPTEPARWPPLPPRDQPDRPDADPAPTVTAAATDDPVAATSPSPTWVEPGDDGSTPDGYPVKAKDSSGIYHVPGGRFHERTRPDRCYASAEAAEADGYRRSKT